MCLIWQIWQASHSQTTQFVERRTANRFYITYTGRQFHNEFLTLIQYSSYRRLITTNRFLSKLECCFAWLIGLNWNFERFKTKVLFGVGEKKLQIPRRQFPDVIMVHFWIIDIFSKTVNLKKIEKNAHAQNSTNCMVCTGFLTENGSSFIKLN